MPEGGSTSVSVQSGESSTVPAHEPGRGVTSIQAKMLLTILPLIVIPMIALAIIGLETASREGAKANERFLTQRENDLRFIAGNNAIHEYFNNRSVGLTEDAEVYRGVLERFLFEFATRSNNVELIYPQIRYIDDRGQEIVKIIDGLFSRDLGQVSETVYFLAARELPPSAVYRSPVGLRGTYAMPVYEHRRFGISVYHGIVVLDFLYPFQRIRATTAVIAVTFVVLAVLGLAIAIPLIIYRVWRVTEPLSRLVQAANLIAAGQRSITVEKYPNDEIGTLAQAFNKMSMSLEENEKEASALYEIGREITAQVAYEPTLQLIVDRARELLHGEFSLLALLEEGGQEFAFQAHSGQIQEALARLRFRAGEGVGGRVAATGQPVMVGDYLEEFRDSPFLDTIAAENLRSGVAVPLNSHRAVVGVLFVHSRTPHKFNKGDMDLLSALAAQATVSIESAKLFQQVKNHADELERKVVERTQELREANLKVETASRHKSEFLANMSHELRTPLNAIIGYSELLQEEAEDLGQEDFIPDLNKISAAGKHLLALINDILDLSKVEAGKMELYLESFDIAAMIGDVATTAQPLFEKNGNTFEAKIPEGLGTMRADLTKTRQVVFNLLSNAAKFTKSGSISLSLERERGAEEDWVVITVSDTGIGMTEEQKGKLFQAFTQADASITREFGGTGLGLAISKQVCEMMGGTIGIESELGKGTTFTVRLPAEVVAPEPHIEDESSSAHTIPDNDTAETILVIDDDPAVRDLMLRLLDKEGFRVVTASSGDEGLRLAKEVRPTVITLDVLMPKMDGWAVLSALKSDSELAEIPVVMVTIVDDKNIGFALGAVEYLNKPVDRNRLVSILRKLSAGRPTCRVLVVDDDPDARDMIRQTGQREGWSVTDAENGRVALERVAESRPDLIILDLFMPEMDGFQFIVELRNHVDYREIPVVVVTAKDITDEERQRLSGHVTKILQKGTFTHEELLTEVRSRVAASVRKNNTATAEHSDG